MGQAAKLAEVLPVVTGIELFEEDFTLEEANGEVDGKSIIGKVRGPFFVPNGTSRNNRFYSESLWRKQLAKSEVQERLKNRQMYGTISHEQPLNDQAFLEGLVSHIVTKLSIEGKKGIGEALILDTKAGRNLKTYLGAKSKFFVSSRATGKFEGEVNGVPAVDEDNYFLRTFDFVTDPGFLDANPGLVEKSATLELVEKAEEIYKKYATPATSTKTTNPPKKDNDMDKEVLEQLVKEKRVLEDNLDAATTELTKAKNDLVIVTDESNHIKEQIVELEKKAALADAFEELGGTAEEIKTKLEEHAALTEALKEVGTVDQITEALDLGEQMGDELKGIQEEFGTRDDINKAFDLAEKRLDEYEELGTPAQISTIMDFADSVQEDNVKTKLAERAKSLSEELKVPVEKIEEIYSSFIPEGKIGDEEGETKLKEFFTGLEEARSNRKRFSAPADLNEGKDNDGDKPTETKLTYQDRMSESRAKRLMGRFQ